MLTVQYAEVPVCSVAGFYIVRIRSVFVVAVGGTGSCGVVQFDSWWYGRASYTLKGKAGLSCIA